jgi:hypothetical protein
MARWLPRVACCDVRTLAGLCLLTLCFSQAMVAWSPGCIGNIGREAVRARYVENRSQRGRGSSVGISPLLVVPFLHAVAAGATDATASCPTATIMIHKSSQPGRNAATVQYNTIR